MIFRAKDALAITVASSKLRTLALPLALIVGAGTGCASTAGTSAQPGGGSGSNESASGSTSSGVGGSGSPSGSGSTNVGGSGGSGVGATVSSSATGNSDGGPSDDAAIASGSDSSVPDEGGVSPSSGGFPRNDMVSTDQKGPYTYMSYTSGLTNPAYSGSEVYYPTNASPPFASVVFSPGFTADYQDYQDFLGPLLASHGIVILLTTPTDTDSDLPQTRAMQLEAAVKQISTENTRSGSPLMGKLATDRICVTGHSMGGGGTLWAATDLGNKIRCDLPTEPWQPGQSFSMITAPTMFIAAQDDTIAAVAQNASFFYSSLPASTVKYYVEFSGASHYLSTGDDGTDYDGQSKYMIAFYKVYLEDDMRYMSVLTGPADKELSTYKHSP